MKVPEPEPIVYSVSEIQGLLRVGRASAQRVAREIGIRVGRRLLIPRVRLEAWLAGEVQSEDE